MTGQDGGIAGSGALLDRVPARFVRGLGGAQRDGIRLGEIQRESQSRENMTRGGTPREVSLRHGFELLEREAGMRGIVVDGIEK